MGRTIGQTPFISPRMEAAIGVLLRAGLTVDLADEHELVVWAAERPDERYRLWPATGYWKRPDGTAGAGGAMTLMADVRQATAPQLPTVHVVIQGIPVSPQTFRDKLQHWFKAFF
jgi:hypothetical protein